AEGALRRLRLLHQAIVDREEQGETLSRLLPGGLADKLRREGRRLGETEELEVTVLMSDIRGYSSLSERITPSAMAAQLNEHRAAMNRAVLAEGGTVMQFVGDAVMAVFGAPAPQADHADRAMAAALAMHRGQAALNDAWRGSDREEFTIGIGLSTGPVAAALLGSEERLEYTLVGDTVNLSQRLQDLARPGPATVVSEATWRALTDPPASAEPLGVITVKGRAAPLSAWRVMPRSGGGTPSTHQAAPSPGRRPMV
ncbi:MAG: adenylate/guanylate cyclase domain-containing protein, partial [Acidimicrobiales bacterium]